MHKIIVLNETGSATMGREYNAFISAICLARMGNEVLYLGNSRFTNEFYEGGRTKDVDIFDLQPPSMPAMLPASLDIMAFDQFDTAAFNTKTKERIDQFGRVDYVFHSGDSYMASFAQQIAESRYAKVNSLDWGDMAPCVNELALRHIDIDTAVAGCRVFHIAERLSYAEDIVPLKGLLAGHKGCQLWLLGYPSSDEPLDQEALHSEDIYWQLPMTDSGRLKLLQTATIYIEPTRFMPNNQAIAEALCLGIPVVVERNIHAERLFGSFVEWLPDGLDRWFEPGAKEIGRGIANRARQFFGFGERITYLHKLIKDTGC